MTRRVFALFSLLNLAACQRCSSSSANTSTPDAAAIPAAPVDAASTTPEAPPLKPSAVLTPNGRVFFGKSKTQREEIATEEVFVQQANPTDKTVRVLLQQTEYTATLGDPAASEDFVKLSMKTASTDAPEPIEMTLYRDGSFEGTHTYSDKSKSVWERTTYRPLATAKQFPASFVGVVGDSMRIRMKLSLSSPTSTTIEGLYRFPNTRVDRQWKGTVDPTTRRLVLDDVDGKGGHLEATVMGHLVGAPFTSSMSLVGTYRNATGEPARPFKVTNGDYPERIVSKGGVALSAQERYIDDCGKVESYIFPVLDNAKAGVAGPFEGALGAIIMSSISPDTTAERLGPQRIVPGSKIQTKCPKNQTPSDWEMHRGIEHASYTPTKLVDPYVALKIEHVYQQGSSGSIVWYDCLVVDLSTGERITPSKLLDEKTRTALTERAKKEALSSMADAGPPGSDSLVDGMRSAAESLTLGDDVPLCIGADKVVFGISQHRVFGPAQPEFERVELAKLLPEGKLRDWIKPDGGGDGGLAPSAPAGDR